MKKLVLCLLLAISILSKGQHRDSIAAESRPHWAKVVIAPAVLLGSGLLLRGHDHEINRRLAKNSTIESEARLSQHVADYSQYAPMAIYYGISIAGAKGEHKILKSTSLLIQSEILMMAIVRPLKKFSHVERPDGSDNFSFPSGHTAQAFTAATFLHKEFGKKSIWYSIAGYSMATSVGLCRMASNRHWMSDVLFGAGAGILSTNMIYYFHKHRNKKNTNDFTATPTITRGSAGFYLSMRL